MTFFLILAAGLLGIGGHWLNRYIQERTESTFFEYLMVYKARTFGSVFSIVGSSTLIFQSAPVDIAGRDLIMLLLSAYTAGYMLDSAVNKDAPVPVPVPAPVVLKPIENNANADKNKSLNNILADDRDL